METNTNWKKIKKDPGGYVHWNEVVFPAWVLTDRLFRVLDVEPPTKAPDKPEPAPGNLAASIIREADLIGHLDCRIKSLLDRLQL